VTERTIHPSRVHAAETGGGETLGEPWEQDAVGGHGEIADARNAGQPLHDVDQVGAERRLAASPYRDALVALAEALADRPG